VVLVGISKVISKIPLPFKNKIGQFQGKQEDKQQNKEENKQEDKQIFDAIICVYK